MGYYGLPKAKLPDELNALEKLLRTLSLEGSIEALDLLETLTRNVIQNPTEDKFRRVRTTNEKLSPLFRHAESFAIMQEMGWRDDSDFVILPKGVELDFPTHVVKILEAKSHFAKLRETAKKTAKLGEDSGKAKLMQQLELDRKERAANHALTQASALAPPPAVTTTVVPTSPAATAPAATAPAAKSEEKPKPPKSSFDFAPREKPQEKLEKAELTLQELRALQKDKFNEFKADPNAKKSEAYQRPPAVDPKSSEPGFFDWMWGGSSSSGGGGGGGNDRPSGPRMKTMRDLPAPVKRG